MTKATYKYYFLVLMVVAITTQSCKKFLEQPSYNNVVATELFKDFQGARTVLVGCYDNFKDANYYQRSFALYPEVTGGNTKYSRGNSLTESVQYLSYNFSNTPFSGSSQNDMSDFYALAYNTIYSANAIFQYIGLVTDANQLQKNRLLADARTIRAMAHFDLVRVFAQPYSFTSDASHEGVVIRKVNTTGSVDSTQVSVKEVYDFILSDLDSAIVLYNNSTAIYAGGTYKSWLSADAASALRAKVSLYKNDWAAVVSYTTPLITKYPIMSNSAYSAAFYKQAFASESIFELAQTNLASGSIGDNYNNVSSTFGVHATSNDLLNLFATGDVRGTMFVTKTLSAGTFSFNKKYQGTADSANNIKVLRSSELVLSRAEANAQLGNLTTALTDLNNIRRRANPTAAILNISSKPELLDSIFTERRRELCFESNLFFDIGRQKRNLVRIDCTATTASFTYPNSNFACPKPLLR
ncbi:MAG: RagB/SusD family nutrient uptake outer membrane protein [Flavobacterium sp.]|nr:RagB/SusD family nutrient uptake outer membrane protein [Flavobacterium sp.]